MRHQQQNILIAFYTFISIPVVLLLLQTFLSPAIFAVKGGTKELNNTITTQAISKQYIECKKSP